MKTILIVALALTAVAAPHAALSQVAAGADQYYLENGVTTVAKSSLLGSDKYVKALNTVASESYPDNYTQGVTITVEGIAGARTVTYAP